MKKLWILGTGTDVGKTFIAAHILSCLRKSGHNWGYLKPVLSGAVERDGRLIPEDASYVVETAGLEENPMDLVVHCYREPLSPHLAAKKDGKVFSVKAVEEKISSLESLYDGLIIESAGGVAVPLNEEGLTTSDLVSIIGGDVLVVAKAELGTISHTITAVDYLKAREIVPIHIILNEVTEKDLVRDDSYMINKLSNISVLEFPSVDTVEDNGKNPLEKITSKI